jgi:hypothetical protein
LPYLTGPFSLLLIPSPLRERARVRVSTTFPVAVGEGGNRFLALAGLGLAFDAIEIKRTIETYYTRRQDTV